MPITKVIGYGRTSTDKQQISPEVQEDKIRRWFDYKSESGKWPDGARFIGMLNDEAVSSRIDMLKRPQGQKILTELDRGDIVVCSTMSRAFRSASDAENTTNTLAEAGIALQFVDMDVDTSSPEGKLFLGMLAIMARFERDLISERTKDALRTKRKKGEPVCNPPWGWKIIKRNDKSVLVPDIERRVVAEAAMNLFRKGMTRTNLDRQMNYFINQHKMSVPCSTTGLVAGAAAACLGFPKCSLSFASELLGQNVFTLKFVRSSYHYAVRNRLEKAAKQEGLELWETVKN